MNPISYSANRFAEIMLSAGAMAKFFVAVGHAKEKEIFLNELKSKGLEPIVGTLTALALFPQTLREHQGTHFNRKIFVLEGLDSLHQSLGSEIFRRLQFERRTLEKTATFSLLWIESFPTAHGFRMYAPELWGQAHDRAVFLPSSMIESTKLSSWTAKIAILSSLGETPCPKRVEEAGLKDILANLSDPVTRAFGDIFRLSPPDFFLTFDECKRQPEPVPPELIFALGRFAHGLHMSEVVEETDRLLATISPRSPTFDICEIETVLKNVERMYEADGPNAALALLNSSLEGQFGWLDLEAWLWADRPLRLRAILNRAAGHFSKAASDIDRWEEVAQKSGLFPAIASAYEARAAHMEALGDLAQAQTWVDRARRANMK